MTSCRIFSVLAALAGTALAAWAEDGQHTTRVALLPLYQQECGSCHVAYPPDRLPAASWRRLLSDLPRHFGTDASLDAASVRQLAAWLDANAGRSRGSGTAPPEDRITRTSWFIRAHQEVPALAWKRPAVKSPANCGACHPQADQGDFNEDHVRIPR